MKRRQPEFQGDADQDEDKSTQPQSWNGLRLFHDRSHPTKRHGAAFKIQERHTEQEER